MSGTLENDRARAELAASLRSPPPEPFTAAVVVGLATGALPAVLGAIVALVAEAVNGCGQFGDFGCGGYFVLGLFACPAALVAGAISGAMTASRMTRLGTGCSGRDVWRKSFALAVLLLVVLGPLSLALL